MSLMLLLLTLVSAEPPAGAASRPCVFEAIIAADSVPGWKVRNAPPETWVVRDGVLTCTNTGGKWGGWIGSTREYTDLEIELEFKLAPGGNSGVYLRTPEVGHPSEVAMEIQLLDDDDPQYRSLKPTQFCGSIYKIVAPSKRGACPAGKWNRLRVVAIRDHIVVELNGETVVDADAKAYPELARRSPKGFVGLQDHHTTASFRNIRLADRSRATTGPATSRPAKLQAPQS
jgi:hypothetical protein